MSENLFQLTGQWLELLNMAGDPEVDEEVLLTTLEALEGDIEAKADGYAYVIKSLKVQIGALEGEIKAIWEEYEAAMAHKKAVENNIERMKRSLMICMKAMDKPKLKTDRFSFWIQQTPPAVIIDDENNITTKYLIPQPPKVDKDGIKKAIQDGAELPFAHLETHDSLRFR